MPDGWAQGRVCDLLLEDGRTWNLDLISTFFNARDIDLVFRIPLPVVPCEDSFYTIPGSDAYKLD